MTEQQKSLREKRIANLRPFQPGQSGNPGGKRKGPNVTDWMRKHLDQKVPDTPQFVSVIASLGLKNGCTFAEFIARSLIINAAKGNSTAITEVMERLEGKIMLPVGHGANPDAGPITFVYNCEQPPWSPKGK